MSVASIAVLPSRPACADDTGSWCDQIYRWTGNDLLARSADVLLGIALIVIVALLVRLVLHRAVDRLVLGAVNGRLPRMLWRRTPRRLREMAAPLLPERREPRARTIGSVLRSTASIVVFVIAAVMILGEFDVNLAPILASAGIVGVALGFGAQNLVKDFLSGMFMLLEDQYGVGDVVDLGQASGSVEQVRLRTTTLRDVHGTVWHVRNGEILRVGNKSHGYAVAVVDVPLGHGADPTRAAAIADRAAAEVVARAEVAPDVLEPPQVLGVDTVTPDGITLRVTTKTNPGRQFAVQRALNAALAEAFDAEDLPRPATGARPSGPAEASPAPPPSRA
ncbi:MAG: mechanosensitive ion channel family protein [Pseudonocardia sp.]